VIDALALRLDRPVRILVAFLAGGLLTTITIGILLVRGFENWSFAAGSRPPANPTLFIALGTLSLVAAYFVSRARPAKPEPKGPSAAERLVARGVPLAFAAGIILNIVPGTFPFIAMLDIAQLDVETGTQVATIVVFYLIMFAFTEIPIVAFLIAPAWTKTATRRVNEWLDRNGRRLVALVLAVVGAYLVVRGLVTALD